MQQTAGTRNSRLPTVSFIPSNSLHSISFSLGVKFFSRELFPSRGIGLKRTFPETQNPISTG
jgi:hypothetical protein